MEDVKTKFKTEIINVADTRGGACKVLIVEDEPSLLSMYKMKFEKEGFEVYSANDGAPGLELAKKHHPDIVLLDVVLNNTDGFYVLKKLKQGQETKMIPVIIISNLSTTKDMQYGLNNGADGYLIKAHTTPMQLVEKVREMMKARAL